MNDNEEILVDEETSETDDLLDVQNEQLDILKDIHRMIRFFYKISIIGILLGTTGFALWLRDFFF